MSSSSSPETPDDDSPLTYLDSKASTFLSEEDKNLLMRIRKRLAELHEPLYRRFAEQIQDDDFMMAGIELVDGRGTDQIRNSVSYFTTSFVEILIAANPGEKVNDDFSRLTKRARRRRQRRQKYMGQLQPLSAESEKNRQQFKHMVEKRCGD